MKIVDERIFKFIQKNNLISKNDKVLIALSGGPDSVFCLRFFKKYQKKFKIDLYAAHVNHQLRGKDSQADEKFCSELCRRENINLFVFSKDVKRFAAKNKVSIEEAGRLIRYKFFNSLMIKNGFHKLITAHTLDDNSETVMLNFTKGTGISGLSGIPVKRDYIIRPLLSVTKKEILAYLKSEKQPFQIDKSNYSNEFQRNLLRQQVIPLLNRINPKFAEATMKLSDISRMIGNHISRELQGIVSEYKIGIDNPHLPLNPKFIKDEFILSELVKYIFSEILQIGFESNDFEKIKTLFQAQKGKSFQLKNKWFASKEVDEIFFFKKENKKSQSIYSEKNGKIEFDGKTLIIKSIEKGKWNFSNNRFVEFIDSDKVGGKLSVRKWKSGDKFIPLGMTDFKKISDFLTDSKINSIERKNIFVLTNRNNILWIIGLRISDKVKVTDKTKKIIKLLVK